MEIIQKNILDIEFGLVAHQTNCLGGFASGVAGAIKAKYPIVPDRYFELVRRYKNKGLEKELLGTIQIVPISDDLKIVNCFSQYDYGRDSNKVYTIYEAVESCFKRINLVNYRKLPVYIPYKYGSGLANGNWNDISEIIDRVCPGVVACSIE